VGLRDAVGGDPLGFSGLGLAFPFCLDSFRALCCQAGQATQEDNRMGLAVALAGEAVVPTAQDRGRNRSTLLGLFSLVTLLAHHRMVQAAGVFRRQAAWYHKSHPTFADALALVRKELWAQEETFCGSRAQTDTVKVPRAFVERLTDAVCYAA
jgi:hypothetical protein